jgi:hypothetical protein
MQSMYGFTRQIDLAGRAHELNGITVDTRYQPFNYFFLPIGYTLMIGASIPF